MALAALALIVVAALAVAIVALNSAKAAAPVTTVATGAPPAVIDHGWSSAVDYGQSVSNVPFYDHGWSKVNEPGQSVSNVPFNDHGWSTAGTAAASKPILNSSYFDNAGPYVPFNVNYGKVTVGSRIDAVDHGARDAAAAAALGAQIDAIDHGARDERASEPQYVAPRPRNQ